MDNTAPGMVIDLEPGIRRVLAPNPSPMTYHGTNTYLLGTGDVAVVDPGPELTEHAAALTGALGPGERITHILVTHSHRDHSPLAQRLSDATGALIYAFGDSLSGRSPVMTDLAAAGLVGGGEGVDLDFVPHEALADGDVLHVGGLDVTALWTPGHMGNHMSFAVGDAVLTGDLIMGWASTMISPPDGDLTAFMTSVRGLGAGGYRVFYPGHGDPIAEPAARAEWLVQHRLSREATIRAALGPEPRRIPDLTRAVYHDTPAALMPAAERNVLAHLIDLVGRGLVQAAPSLSWDAEFFT